jgi:hypothetical protein
MVETKVIMTTLFYILGIPITLLGIVENYGTLKADALFLLSAIILSARIYYYIVEKNQKRKKTEMELRLMEFKINKEIEDTEE